MMIKGVKDLLPKIFSPFKGRRDSVLVCLHVVFLSETASDPERAFPTQWERFLQDIPSRTWFTPERQRQLELPLPSESLSRSDTQVDAPAFLSFASFTEQAEPLR